MTFHRGAIARLLPLLFLALHRFAFTHKTPEALAAQSPIPAAPWFPTRAVRLTNSVSGLSSHHHHRRHWRLQFSQRPF